jgi:hypothetical protein
VLITIVGWISVVKGAVIILHPGFIDMWYPLVVTSPVILKVSLATCRITVYILREVRYERVS